MSTADYLQLILTMIRPLGRQKGITERGHSYILSQWEPNVIQLTLQTGDYVITETLENIRSEAEMMERRTLLENELIEWMASTKQLTENTSETNN